MLSHESCSLSILIIGLAVSPYRCLQAIDRAALLKDYLAGLLKVSGEGASDSLQTMHRGNELADIAVWPHAQVRVRCDRSAADRGGQFPALGVKALLQGPAELAQANVTREAVAVPIVAGLVCADGWRWLSDKVRAARAIGTRALMEAAPALRVTGGGH